MNRAANSTGSFRGGRDNPPATAVGLFCEQVAGPNNREEETRPRRSTATSFFFFEEKDSGHLCLAKLLCRVGYCLITANILMLFTNRGFHGDSSSLFLSGYEREPTACCCQELNRKGLSCYCIIQLYSATAFSFTLRRFSAQSGKKKTRKQFAYTYRIVRQQMEC